MRTALRRSTIAVLTLLVGAVGLLIAPSATAAGPLDGFDPGLIVTDEAFYDTGRITREEVAAQIALRGAECVTQTGTPCLKDYRVDTPAVAPDAFCTGAIGAVTANTAAGIVHAVGVACGINPEMLLVLIQKESSLLTNRGDTLSPDLYARATGMGCPDYQPCHGEFASFFGQVYGAASRFQQYRANPLGYPYRVRPGNSILYNPEESCGRASVNIKSQATAGLYIYTPYVPNAAALANPTGEGDVCSAYGNRNFYRILKAWFPGSAPTATGAPIAPTPPSTITPALRAISAKASDLGVGRTGAARGFVTCAAGGSPTSGPCWKRFDGLSITWTARGGVKLGTAVPSGRTPVALTPFRDVPANNQFATEIEWLAAAGISTGWSSEKGGPEFRPLQPVNRDAMAAFLYRAAGSPDFTPPARATFRDVPRSNQFYREIEWLAAKGISTGWVTDAGKEYRPLQPVARDAMAAFLYRYQGQPWFPLPATARFADVPVGTQFRKEIEWLAARGITTGWPDATFRPLSSVNRDAMAAFLYRRAG